jgi:hypothetical protein
MGINSVWSARNAILEAYSIEMQSTSGFDSAGGPSSTTTTHKIANKYEAAKVIAAVENQSELKGWLIWAYGPAVMASLQSVQESAVALVGDSVDLTNGRNQVQAVKIRAQLLVYLHMENYRALAITGVRKYRKADHFNKAMRRLTSGAIGLDTKNRNYARDFGFIAGLVEQRCSDLDRQGLGKVAKALINIRSLRGDQHYWQPAPFAAAS